MPSLPCRPGWLRELIYNCRLYRVLQPYYSPLFILNPQLISYLLPLADRVQIGMPCLLILFQHYFLVCAFWLFLATCPLKLPPHVDPQPVKCCDVVRLAKRKTVLLHGCADENSL